MKRAPALLASVLGALVVQAQETCERTQVAVLGAGVAGIEAAAALSANNVDDFVIVEYQDRIGGRMHDVEFGEGSDGSPYTVEAGANWVQGTVTDGGPENPVYTLAKKYGIIYNADNLTMFDAHGRTDFKYAIDEFGAALEQVSADAGSLLLNNLQDRTYRAGLRLQGWDPAKNDPYCQTAEWWLFDGEFVYRPEESSEIFTSVAENATFNYFSDENLFVYDQRGFGTIIREEARTFLSDDDDRLRLNTQGTVEFQPPLPDWKVAAIHSFEIGTYTKIFMQFNDSFWDPAQYLIYADPETRGYYPEFQPLDLPGVLEGSGLLVATVVNDQSYRVEAQSNEQTQAEVMGVLRSMYGEHIPDLPDGSVVYAVDSDSLDISRAYGSYSNWPPATSLQAHQTLRANVGNLFFAGEATSQEFFGYLQGACFEGRHTGAFIASCIHGSGTVLSLMINGTILS